MKKAILILIFSIHLILIFFFMPIYVIFCIWDSTIRNRWRYYKYLIFKDVCDITDIILGIDN
jgi:hypothetical protein